MDAPYTLRSLEQMLGLSRSVIAGLIAAGYVTPQRGPRREYRFSFQDVVLLRTAHHLQAANIAPRRLMRSLKLLRERLPPEVPMSGLRITAVGNDVAVREGSAHWEARTGQLLLDFEVRADQGVVTMLQRSPPEPPAAPESAAQWAATRSAADWFCAGEAMEEHDRAGAEAAYRQALALSPDHVYAHVNLGALLCESGRCGEAVALYERAVQIAPDVPSVHFNAGIALEDQHREADALASYRRCLDLAPDLADAHYNAARLCEKLGDGQGAVRHYAAYRRLQKAGEQGA